MTKDPAYIRNLRAKTRSAPKIEHLEALEKELYVSGNDRATVVLFGSFLEEHLGQLLMSTMRADLNSDEKKQLLEYEGAIGSFSSKIIMAYALKLIGPITRFDLNLIRILRNEFAHSRMPFDFSTPEVCAVCDNFKMVDLPGNTLPFGYLNRVSHGELEAAVDKTNPKTRFISTCHNISYRMLVKREGPKPGDFVFPDDNPLP